MAENGAPSPIGQIPASKNKLNMADLARSLGSTAQLGGVAEWKKVRFCFNP
jgi:hypothetical protein